MFKYLTAGQIITTVVVGVIASFFFYSVSNALTLPDVWYSYSTGDCVKVLNYAKGDTYSCENLPSRFYHVWVE
jgi:hypothetical protein